MDLWKKESGLQSLSPKSTRVMRVTHKVHSSEQGRDEPLDISPLSFLFSLKSSLCSNLLPPWLSLSFYGLIKVIQYNIASVCGTYTGCEFNVRGHPYIKLLNAWVWVANSFFFVMNCPFKVGVVRIAWWVACHTKLIPSGLILPASARHQMDRLIPWMMLNTVAWWKSW